MSGERVFIGLKKPLTPIRKAGFNIIYGRLKYPKDNISIGWFYKKVRPPANNGRGFLTLAAVILFRLFWVVL